MKRLVSILLAVTVCISLCACHREQEMTVCLGGFPDTLDPASSFSSDTATYILHCFEGLYGWTSNKGRAEVVPACIEVQPDKQYEDGKVIYTFTLKEDLKWSDGSKLTADDFVYAWNRAADPFTKSGFGYLFSCIDGYQDMKSMYVTDVNENGAYIVCNSDGTPKYKNGICRLNVTSLDQGRKLRVVLVQDIPYFDQLCATPAFVPVKQDSVQKMGEEFGRRADGLVCNGAYTVEKFEKTALVLEKNPKYHNANEVKTDKLIFSFCDEETAMKKFRKGEVAFVENLSDPASLQEKYKDELSVESQMGTYCFSFNVNDPVLSAFDASQKTDIRKALSLLIDREYLAETVGEKAANGFVAMGFIEPDGLDYTMKNGPLGDGQGYIDVADAEQNKEKALALLQDVAKSSGVFEVRDGKLEGFPELTLVVNNNSPHDKMASYLKDRWGEFGITLQVETLIWEEYLVRYRHGDFSMIRDGWIADYNDPLAFLERYGSDSGNNNLGLGQQEHGEYRGFAYREETELTWEESYDRCLQDIFEAENEETRFQLMHKAEDLIMSTAAVMPIYYYTDTYLRSTKLDGFYTCPQGYRFFMYADWAE